MTKQNLIKFAPLYYATELKERPFKYLPIEDYVKTLKPSNAVFEYLIGDMVVKPYFDYELYFKPEEECDTDIILSNAIKEIHSIIPGLDVKDIAVAEAHRIVIVDETEIMEVDGYTKKNKIKVEKFKVSFRMIIQGSSILFYEIENIIIEAKLSKGFDTSVYKKKGQVIGGVGVHKTKQDPRIFTPLTAHSKEDFVIQYLNGDELPIIIKPKNTN